MGQPPRLRFSFSAVVHRLQRVSREHHRWLPALALGSGLVTLAWLGSDRLGQQIYGQVRPKLELLVGRAMGHRLQLGVYRGLRPWGLAVGSSRFLPQAGNPSSVEASSVVVGLDPWRSLLQRQWVLAIRLYGAKGLLRPDAHGRFWNLGQGRPGAQPPHLGLNILVADPAIVEVVPPQGAVPGLARTRLAVWGRTGLDLRRHRLHLDLQAAVPATASPRQGRLQLRGDLQWQQHRWQFEALPRALELEALLPLLPEGVQRQLAGQLDGVVAGRVRLTDSGLRHGGGRRCDGTLQLERVRWRWHQIPQPLLARSVRLHCYGQRLVLQPAALALGPWQGVVAGRFNLGGAGAGQLLLSLAAQERRGGHRLRAQLLGPWRHPQVELRGDLRLPRLGAANGRGRAAPLDVAVTSRLAIESRGGLRVAVPSLQVATAGSRLQARGQLWPRLDLRSNRFAVPGALLPSGRALALLVGQAAPIQAQLAATGSLERPGLLLNLQQARNPLLGPLQAGLRWRDGVLHIDALRSPELRAWGQWPLALTGRGLRPGSLVLNLDLRRYPLARLSPLVGVPLAGQVSAVGLLAGPLQALAAELQLDVHHPGAGPVALDEVWRGSLTTQAGAATTVLQLYPLAPAPPADLTAHFDGRGLPTDLRLRRLGGELGLQAAAGGGRWWGQSFPLEGLKLVTAGGRREPLQGLLSGAGALAWSPFRWHGDLAVEGPVALGVRGRRLKAQVSLGGAGGRLDGDWWAEGQGRIGLRLRRQGDGRFWNRFEARGLGIAQLRQFLGAWPRWRGETLDPSGKAADLGTVAIEPGDGLDGALAALALAQRDLLAAAQLRDQAGQTDLRDLRGQVDADLTLQGQNPAHPFLDLQARGQLWTSHADVDLPLASAPFSVQIHGPLASGSGDFDLQHLPLSLLALLTPVPPSLRGALAAKGRYRLGTGVTPSLEANLALEQASLAGQPLVLSRGQVHLASQVLDLDWSLRGGGAAESVDLRGLVPLSPADPRLELRLSSRGDGLRFLADLGGDGLELQRGDADLQLLVRGSLQDPIANGFLRLRDTQLRLAGQTLRDLQATVLFDFSELELQQLSARVGERGSLSGGGHLALARPGPQQLNLQLRQAAFELPRLKATADGAVRVGGSLLHPLLGGELRLAQGSVNISPGQLATEKGGSLQPTTVPELVEQRWDFQQPVVVMGAAVESDAGRAARQAVPNLPFLGFDGLRLRIGPDLRIAVPNVLNFNTEGLVTLRGPLDPSLRASGVVRLRSGRLSLFTTTFSLDPDAPNVAVFTPGLGLLPYLDIALRTRVSESVNLGGGQDRSSIYDWNQAGAGTGFSQLNLVKVVLTASGPADRLMDHIQLRSTPPLPQDRLVALIGGNSLAGLNSGNAGAALATALGQSLLSPLVGGLSDAFGQRFSFALYPTYFAPAETSATANRSRRIPSQLVLGSEIGLDLSERFNFSVLAAPNRSDIPPQATLRYQASDRIGLQGSVDTEGRWQGQLQLFFRF